MAQGFGIGALTETLSEPSVLLLSFSMSGGAFTVMVGSNPLGWGGGNIIYYYPCHRLLCNMVSQHQ